MKLNKEDERILLLCFELEYMMDEKGFDERTKEFTRLTGSIVAHISEIISTNNIKRK